MTLRAGAKIVHPDFKRFRFTVQEVDQERGNELSAARRRGVGREDSGNLLFVLEILGQHILGKHMYNLTYV